MSALRDLADFERWGAATVHVCFDPSPADGWYLELFRGVREAGLRLGMIFECWELPREEFVAEFSASFLPGSRLILSPESGSERVRRLNKSRWYSDAALKRSLETMRRSGVKAEVYFGVGLPGETPEDLLATARLAAELSRRYGCDVADFVAQDGPGDLGYRTEHLAEEDISRRAAQLERLCVRLNERRLAA